MTISELLKLPTEALERMTNEDLMREFGHLLPAIRTPIEGMAGATDTPTKVKSDGPTQKFVSPKAAKMDDMLARLSQMKKEGLL